MSIDTFASNLGRKVSPSATPQAVAKGHKSVKSLATFFEEGAAPAATTVPSSSSSNPSNLPVATSSSVFAPSPSSKPKLLRDPHEPDDNDLTLLDYKQFMANLPLGRCLDDLESPTRAAASSSCQLHPEAPNSQHAQEAKNVLATLDRLFPPLPPLGDSPVPASDPEPSSAAGLELAPEPERTQERAKAYRDATRRVPSIDWDEIEEDDIFRPPSFVLLPPPPSPRPAFSPSSPLLQPVAEEQEDESNESHNSYQQDEQDQQRRSREYQPKERYHQAEEQQHQYEKYQPAKEQQKYQPNERHQPEQPHQNASPPSLIGKLALLSLADSPATPPPSPHRPPPMPTRTPPPLPPSYPPPPIPSITPPVFLSSFPAPPPAPPQQERWPPPGAATRHHERKREEFMKKYTEYMNSRYNPESGNYTGPEVRRVMGPENEEKEEEKKEEKKEKKLDEGNGKASDMFG
ncbi:uncharacterized protein PODANS_2_1490 [Podospora anserina S mat+]|uniref:Podospora anserina S mat+ genomic DNA chromosome 2, supercontig 2 n=1 Tax=Podospora anserina (strain S / ATCC MYA-4624 / DSM 980 / FGSC 10383) TaxID=515849 RepID=B2B4J4_PODAN|nr:uncharacterized protein PODANS_2_1490 [Podospora anserina S mat+]CAP72719.1 unnamed protein product [Podospora anserina S mat+]CDP25116.1 Putative protein of unknown function [Podospora anserina S mat+]